MKPKLNKAPLTLLGKPKGGHKVTLISYEALEVIELEIDVVAQDFVYLDRVWVLNGPQSEELKQPVYNEVNAQWCQKLRSDAGVCMQIAAKYEAQLQALKETVKQ